jgi:hypothetical protein
MAEVNNSDVAVETSSSPPSPSSPLPPPSPSTTSFLPSLEPDTMPALMAAAFKGDGEACERALDTGADPNHSSVECRGFTPLMLAALSGQPPSTPLHSLVCIAASPVISCMTAPRTHVHIEHKQTIFVCKRQRGHRRRAAAPRHPLCSQPQCALTQQESARSDTPVSPHEIATHEALMSGEDRPGVGGRHGYVLRVLAFACSAA